MSGTEYEYKLWIEPTEDQEGYDYWTYTYNHTVRYSYTGSSNTRFTRVDATELIADGTSFYEVIKERAISTFSYYVDQSDTSSSSPTIKYGAVYYAGSGARIIEGFDSEAEARTYAWINYVKSYADSLLQSANWIYSWLGHNPIATEWENMETTVQTIDIIELKWSYKKYEIYVRNSTIFKETTYREEHEEWDGYMSSSSFSLIGTDCTVELGGKVWVDETSTKETIYNGQLDSGESMYAGMQVELKLGSASGTTIATVLTDSSGSYHFSGLNALNKYVIVFTYNGQIYQQTYYKNDLSGGYSNAQESDRDGFNSRFSTIDSDSPSDSYSNYYYGGWHKAYGLEEKLATSDGSYISYNGGALTFEDAWDKFEEYTSSTGSYSSAYSSLSSWLSGLGVGSTDVNGVIQYIQDCMITAYTTTYPVYNQFVIENIDSPSSQASTVTAVGRTWNSLYTSSSDQSRNVDFGIYVRDTADLALQKDVYKTTVRVNGKTETYMYNNKDNDIDDDGNWTVTVRATDYLYNGSYSYTREIRKSEYLYDGTIYASSGSTSAKDLKVYVTYRIVVRNQSQTLDTSVNEIVDYYDSTQYTFDGVLSGTTYTPNSYSDFEHSTITSYVGDRNGNYLYALTVSTQSIDSKGNTRTSTDIGSDYTAIYLSGIKDTSGNTYLTAGGDMAYIYITFEVNTHTDENGMADRIILDENVATGEENSVGKRNIAEVNSYSTKYKSGYTVPSTLNDDDTRNDRDVSGLPAGGVDKDSSPGSLTSKDIDSSGNIISSTNEVTNRLEDDSDKAPNIKLVFPESDDDERVVQGYVYEDDRDTASDEAIVGNGVYDEGETLIDGVTVQLVELVQEVDSDGIPTGNYLGEYVWNAKTWDASTKSWVDTDSSTNSGSLRYYSGQGTYATNNTVAPIISGAGAAAISGYTFTGDASGQYAFKAVPTGDFVIRFIYGDTTQTVLSTSDGESSAVTSLLSGETADGSEGYISTSGLNAKSYTGQDYKSTTYQAYTDGSVKVDQSGSYNGINGYTNYTTQNYSILGQALYGVGTVNTTDGTDKSVMYYYNISGSQSISGLSDAKDVGNIRDNEQAYSSGETGIDSETESTLTNNRAEVLASATEIASNDLEYDSTASASQLTASQIATQVSMLKELMTNTAMIAQTGVIDTTVEWNATVTNNQSSDNEMSYVLSDVDFGLVERPTAQLELTKEITNLKITLQDGTVMFDTNQSVNNLSYAQHSGHSVTYVDENGNTISTPTSNLTAYRLAAVTIANNTARIPELLTTYMDEELMYGARIELTYTFTITNVGEVDYLDDQFYYTGKTSDTSASNISKTSASTVIDYVSNNLQFSPTSSNNKDSSGNTIWSIRTVDELTGHTDADDDLVNSKYADILATYNAIITTKALSTELLPEGTTQSRSGSSVSTTLVLTSTLTTDSGDDNMVYNNLAEIVQTSNSQGRRMKYSIVGNQPMANQDLGSDTQTDEANGIYTKVDLVTPTEIDADSSQKVLILPPTGDNRNYTLWIIVGIIAAAILGVGAGLIKKFHKKKQA